MKARGLLLVTLAAALASASSCTAPAPQACQRYDALALTRENGFSARFDWKAKGHVDLPGEYVEVSLTAIRPMKGPVELVHVVGDTPADTWSLHVPDAGNSLTSVCSITLADSMPACVAVLRNLPLSPGGFWYLRAGDNTVLEAGLAFRVCD